MHATEQGAPRRGRVLLATLALCVAGLAAWVLWPADRPARAVRTTVGNQAQADGTPPPEAVDTPASPAGAREAGAGEVVQLVVRDLWNRDPLPGLDLRVVPPGGAELELRTDARGAIEVDAVVLGDATTWECAGGPYRIASSASRIGRDREIWCYRAGMVQGRVVFPGGLPAALLVPLSSVSLSFSPEHVAAAAEASNGMTWLSRSRIVPTGLPAPLDDGSFRVEVPTLRGAALVARVAGFRAAWQVLDEAALRGEREVILELKPGMRIEGGLRDETGAPLADVQLTVCVVIRMRYEDADIDAIGRIKEWGYTVTRSEKDDETICTLHYMARTDEQGRWAAEVDADGELIVIAYPEGHVAVDLQAGQASRVESGPGLELVARRDAGAAVRLFRNDRPLSNTVVEFCDLSLPGVQPTFRVETDADGLLRSPWLIEGKRYALKPGPAARDVYCVFTGQKRIDVEKCETDVGRFLGDGD